jgi:two-component system nitrogen regulation response regulator GlnG
MTRIIKSSIIVSEDASVVNQLTDILMQHDFTVTIEKSIVKFISSMLEKEISLLILDLDQPQGPNFDSIDIIRKLRPRLPIIVLSADSSLEMLKILAQKGVFYTASKPIQAEEIEEVTQAISLPHTKNSISFIA